MVEIVVAGIGAVALVVVALIERGRRTNNRRWEQNRDDHNHVMTKLDDLGKSLGKSIDRVEDTALRTEAKIDLHINDHVTGKLG